MMIMIIPSLKWSVVAVDSPLLLFTDDSCSGRVLFLHGLLLIGNGSSVLAE